MLSFLLKRFSGRHYKKFLEKARAVVARINELEKSYQSLTDDQLRAKTDEFRGRIAGAADKRAALEAFETSLGMVFMKVPPPEGVPADQYSVDHSATMAVLDPQGRMAGLLRPPLQPDAVAADLAALAAAEGATR